MMKTIEYLSNAKNAVGAIRVSTTKQGSEGDSPEAQREQIERFAANKGFAIKKFFVFLESASKEQQPMQEAINYCTNPKNDIGHFIIKSIDRFTRGGSLSYNLLKTQLEDNKVKLVDIHGIIGAEKINTLEHLGIQYGWSVYSPSKKSEILEAERSKDELRDIMTRVIGAEIRYTRLGYWMRKPPYGYISRRVETAHGKRTILEPHPTEAEQIIEMFRLKSLGQYTDTEIVCKINEMGYQGHGRGSSGSRPAHKSGNGQKIKLTPQQMWRMVRHPIYAGIICEKWTNNRPIKTAFSGLIPIDLFNRANRNRRTISKDSNGKMTIEDFKEKRYTDKGKRSDMFPFKRFVLCPECRKPLHGSASKGRSGKLYPAYHCRRQGHNFRISKRELESKVDALISNLRLTPDLADQITRAMDKACQRLNELRDKRIKILDGRISALKSELGATVQKIKVLNNETAIRYMEDELVRLEKEIKHAEDQKRILTVKKPIDLKEIGKRLKHLFEHFDQAVKNQMNPVKKAKLFGLLFNQAPTYSELNLRTAKNKSLTDMNPLFLFQNNPLFTSGTPKETFRTGFYGS